jgi:hypothetical protein
MHNPFGLGAENPPSTWVAHVSSESVATALKHLLEIAVEQLCWFDEEEGDPILEVIASAKALASIVTENSLTHDLLSVPVQVAVLAARQIDEGADRFETGVLIDPFNGDLIDGGRYLVTTMRDTAGALRNASGGL